MTRNLLLEHAQGDLGQYWAKTSPPKTNADIVNFYTQLFNLSAALDSIHSITDKESGCAPIRHGDLKPANILRFTDCSGSLGVLKIGDLGSAKIHAIEGRGGKSWQVFGGSRAYCK